MSKNSRRTFLKQVLGGTSLVAAGGTGLTSLLSDFSAKVGVSRPLFDAFQAPPVQARPLVRWWWNGNRVEEGEILRELDLLKDAGVGGVEINPIALPGEAADIGAEALEWLSPEWCRMVEVAVEGARERGMIADLIVGAGWPFGGPFLEPEETSQRVGFVKQALEGPGVYEGSYPELVQQSENLSRTDARPELLYLYLVPQGCERAADITDLTDRLRSGETIRFEIPSGKHTLYAVDWQQNIRTVHFGAPGADGPVLNHYDEAAVETYLNHMSETLSPYLGGRLGNGLRAMFCDSIELSGSNWTDGLPEIFEERHGYPLVPYLPLVLDKSQDESLTAQPLAENLRRVRYDFSETLVSLFHKNFVQVFDDWCHANGTLSRYQAYGTPFLMGMLEGYTIPDIPEGDTWIHYPTDRVGPRLDQIRYAVWNKYASSGGHLAGQRVISCEAMTNVHGVFRASLADIKQADDLNFITGINQSVLHGFSYSPPEAGFPGWVRYGTYFSEQNPWWPYFQEWTRYNARLSHLFQRSRPQVEVAILGPTAQVWSERGLSRPAFIETPWYLHHLWQAVHQNGYSADYLNEEIIQKATFEEGRLISGEMEYRVVMLASVEALQPETAQALKRFVEAGGQVVFIGTRPERSPGLRGDQSGRRSTQKDDRAVKTATSETVRRPGAVVVEEPAEGQLLSWTGEVLSGLDAPPAVDIAPLDRAEGASGKNGRLFQIRHEAEGRDIYFFCNLHRDQSTSFRGTFPTGSKTPWTWDPETGERRPFPYDTQKNELAVRLGPLESLVLVFEPGRDAEPSPDRARQVAAAKTIDTAWQARLRTPQGRTFERRLQTLVDFSQAEELASFGGTARYRTVFDVEQPTYDRLDLGQVHGVSDVTLNGTPLGVRWYGEHVYDLGSALEQGENVLTITLETTLYNYARSLTDNPTAQKWTSDDEEPEPVGLEGPVRLLRIKG